MNDLPIHIHESLDSDVSQLSTFSNIETHAAQILHLVISCCAAEYRDIWPINKDRDVKAYADLLASRPDILADFKSAYASGKYAQIRNLPEFHTKKQEFMAIKRTDELITLRDAYKKPYLGKAADTFVNYLVKTERDSMKEKLIYAKAVPIVQSSGAGKSRMLTEAGKKIFTLPICLREPHKPGYPPSDITVYNYFAALQRRNDLSVSGHAAIACFLGAAHKTMLDFLYKAQNQNRNPKQLLEHWHTTMQDPKSRGDFFEKVVNLATSMGRDTIKHTSPKRDEKGFPDRPEFNILEVARNYYNQHMKHATKLLTTFVSSLTPQHPVVVTYFDEAHELQLSYWILLRLVANQDHKTPMWYVFMGTQSSIPYSSPSPQDIRSLRLRQEIERLLGPYFALGFDQNVTSKNRSQVTVRMGYLQSIEHLSKYGRPLWNAQFVKGEEDRLIDVAARKLVNLGFSPEERDHVLAVLSQRVCVDTVLVGADALQLADRSVANHMRLLTGFSHNYQVLHTHTPSEPMLALGAARLVYSNGSPVLKQVLKTFSHQLCEAGLVEKGLPGELASRILLTIARDEAAPITSNGPDLLKPVLLLKFLDELFGTITPSLDGKKRKWCNPCEKDFDAAFGDTYVNFTHWVVTKDSFPEKPSQQLLANLWARGAALQCCFQQESLDLLIVTYKGSVGANAIFDVEKLSGIVVQVKYKTSADTKAGSALQPIGIPRSTQRPLPYIALLMELGNESKHQSTQSKFLATASPLPDNDTFGAHVAEHGSAVNELSAYRLQKEQQSQKKKRKRERITQKQMKVEDHQEAELKKKVDDARVKMDACNRFSIFVRGASPEVYGILRKANIIREFAHLLDVTLTLPTDQDTQLNYIRPLERLAEKSDHNAWMSVYLRGEGGEDEEGEGEDGGEDREGRPMDVDP